MNCTERPESEDSEKRYEKGRTENTGNEGNRADTDRERHGREGREGGGDGSCAAMQERGEVVIYSLRAVLELSGFVAGLQLCFHAS